MALLRRTGQRVTSSIWTGFVDAMTGLLLVFMFVLSMFMIVQFTLSGTISTQSDELAQQTRQIDDLTDRLRSQDDTLERLTVQIGQLTTRRKSDEAQIDDLTSQLQERDDALAGLSEQIVILTARNESDEAQIANLTNRIGESELAQMQLREDLDEKLTKLAEYEQRVEIFRMQVAALNDELETTRDNLARQRTESEATVQRQESEIQSLADLLAILQREKKQQADLIAALQDQKREFQALATRLQTELATETEQLAEVRQKADDSSANLRTAEQQIESLTADLERADRTQAQKQTEIDQLVRQSEVDSSLIETLRQSLRAIEDANALLEIRLGDTEERTATLSRSLEEEQEARRAVLSRLSAADQQILWRLEEIKELRISLGNLSEESDRRQRRIVAQDNVVSSLKTQVESLADELATVRAAREEEGIQTRAEIDRLARLKERADAQTIELNRQLSELRTQLANLQSTLDQSEARNSESQAQISSLGQQLNSALAEKAAEAENRRKLEERERQRLEREKRNLEQFRSDFFGRLRQVLEGRAGVSITGDRFVLAAEVLFESGEAELSEVGKQEIGQVARLITEVAEGFPADIDWALRVDGHTDDQSLREGTEYVDNWGLSQARALSVVRLLTEEYDFPPNRVVATGFGEFRPLESNETPEGRSRNRRIEFKLTEP
ncbi:MAG: peptidoglycan -binding protein [Rhodobacteraceae bacterium]|nr:peptidoglycan -binding protein [Paracoccaceae bacterium]MCY4326947.1 peptidoglycan -binding protein [Paracoccaceae bacterium]